MKWEQWQQETPPDGMVDAFRDYLQDLRSVNRLYGGLEQLAEDQLVRCLKHSLDNWNTTPPVSSVTFLKHPSVILLFLGASVRAQDMMAFQQTHNQLTYSDGGISTPVSDKTALHVNHGSRLQAEYETGKRQSKTAANLETFYGGSWSEYRSLGGRRALDFRRR